ncbi:MAG: hypothetical protein EPO64_05955 [Nitrospirae bacterium]|nr:MAG: hypothetical protein EPO64_05955 [Nitrospirota bacterium]
MGDVVGQGPRVADRIIEAVSLKPGCLLEDLVLDCLDLTWNQVFMEVDRLSRTGQLRLQQERPGQYSVRPARKMIAS